MVTTDELRIELLKKAYFYHQKEIEVATVRKNALLAICNTFENHDDCFKWFDKQDSRFTSEIYKHPRWYGFEKRGGKRYKTIEPTT